MEKPNWVDMESESDEESDSQPLSQLPSRPAPAAPSERGEISAKTRPEPCPQNPSPVVYNEEEESSYIMQRLDAFPHKSSFLIEIHGLAPALTAQQLNDVFDTDIRTIEAKNGFSLLHFDSAEQLMKAVYTSPKLLQGAAFSLRWSHLNEERAAPQRSHAREERREDRSRERGRRGRRGGGGGGGGYNRQRTGGGPSGRREEERFPLHRPSQRFSQQEDGWKSRGTAEAPAIVFPQNGEVKMFNSRGSRENNLKRTSAPQPAGENASVRRAEVGAGQTAPRQSDEKQLLRTIPTAERPAKPAEPRAPEIKLQRAKAPPMAWEDESSVPQVQPIPNTAAAKADAPQPATSTRPEPVKAALCRNTVAPSSSSTRLSAPQPSTKASASIPVPPRPESVAEAGRPENAARALPQRQKKRKSSPRRRDTAPRDDCDYVVKTPK